MPDIYELRDGDRQWGNFLPDITDYDDPDWTTNLTQEQTPYGLGWVDGSRQPQKARLNLRVYVSATTAAGADARYDEVMAWLIEATAFRDLNRSALYLIAQGILGEPKVKRYRGGTARMVEVTLALRDPYWHATDEDGSTSTTPNPGGVNPLALTLPYIWPEAAQPETYSAVQTIDLQAKLGGKPTRSGVIENLGDAEFTVILWQGATQHAPLVVLPQTSRELMAGITRVVLTPADGTEMRPQLEVQ